MSSDGGSATVVCEVKPPPRSVEMTLVFMRIPRSGVTLRDVAGVLLGDEAPLSGKPHEAQQYLFQSGYQTKYRPPQILHLGAELLAAKQGAAAIGRGGATRVSPFAFAGTGGCFGAAPNSSSALLWRSLDEIRTFFFESESVAGTSSEAKTFFGAMLLDLTFEPPKVGELGEFSVAFLASGVRNSRISSFNS